MALLDLGEVAAKSLAGTEGEEKRALLGRGSPAELKQGKEKEKDERDGRKGRKEGRRASGERSKFLYIGRERRRGGSDEALPDRGGAKPKGAGHRQQVYTSKLDHYSQYKYLVKVIKHDDYSTSKAQR
ncbi:MAG: hypothetical protein M1816_002757, partial [Peltula sp. TS41687]